MAHFLYRLNSPRPTFPGDMTADEGAVMGEHAAYWSDLLGRGSVVVYGPVLDPAGAFGMAVVEADDAADIDAIGTADPAVAHGLCTFDVLAMPSAHVRPTDGR